MISNHYEKHACSINLFSLAKKWKNDTKNKWVEYYKQNYSKFYTFAFAQFLNLDNFDNLENENKGFYGSESDFSAKKRSYNFILMRNKVKDKLYQIYVNV